MKELLHCMDAIPQGVYLVGTKKGEGYNLMTAAFVTQVSFNPASLAVSVAKPHYTAELIQAQGEFTLSGETYKKPRAQAPSELLAPWYVLKGFSLSHDEALTEELFSREILERAKAGFDFLLPYYRYFSTLCAEGD